MFIEGDERAGDPLCRRGMLSGGKRPQEYSTSPGPAPLRSRPSMNISSLPDESKLGEVFRSPGRKQGQVWTPLALSYGRASDNETLSQPSPKGQEEEVRHGNN